MADSENRGFARAQSTATRTSAVPIDEGLRSYMLKVYNYMALGVAFTAVITMALAANPEIMATVALGPMKWVLFAGILGLGFFAPKLIFSGNTALAHVCFWGYAAMWGALISPMIYYFFSVADGSSLVIRALAITSVTFGATSLFGYVTKRDLSGLGSFFMMACIGLLVAIVVNAIFFQDIGLSLFISCAVVLLFSAITAYETQLIKRIYVQSDGSAVTNQKAIMGAFMLYGSFVTLFIHILSILGIMSGD
jgi:hypothetical protein